MYCGLATTIIDDGPGIKAFPFKCNCWHCESCFYRRLWSLKELAKAGKPSKFITLTASVKDYDTPSEAAQALVHGWRMLLQRMKRDGIVKEIEYLAVFEETQQGWPHLHILARAPYIPQEYISRYMDKYADSPIVDIRKVYTQRHAAWYVAKYVSKGPGRFEGTKRYFRSKNYVIDQDYLNRKKTTPHSLAVTVEASLCSVMSRLCHSGWSVTHDVSQHRLEGRPTGKAGWPHYFQIAKLWGTGPPSWLPPS